MRSVLLALALTAACGRPAAPTPSTPVPAPATSDVTIAVPASADVAQVEAALRRRLDGLDARIELAGRRVHVTLGAVAIDRAALRGLLTAPGRLELRRVIGGHPVLRLITRALLAGERRDVRIGEEVWVRDEDTMLLGSDLYLTADDPQTIRDRLAELADVEPGLALPPDTAVLFVPISAAPAAPVKTLLVAPPVVTSDDVATAAVVAERGGTPRARIELTEDGRRRYRELTAQRAGDRLAIVLDGEVVAVSIVSARGDGPPAIEPAPWAPPLARDPMLLVRAIAAPLPAGLTLRAR